MSMSLDDHSLPTIVRWLVDLNGETQVRGILGDDFDAIRSGELGLHEMAPDLKETLCKMAEGAIAAGMKPPLPPEPDGPLPEVPQAPTGGGGQDVRRGPDHSEGRAAAPPPIMKLPPRAAPSAQTRSEKLRIIREKIRPIMEERAVLRSLLKHLRQAEDRRPHNHPLNRWIMLAENKVRHCLVADYYAKLPDARGHHMPRGEELAFLSRLIKRAEQEIAELSNRSVLRRLFCGKGYLAPEEVIEQVARHNNLKLRDELMQAILRQGRD